jgi:hypothetical protein
MNRTITMVGAALVVLGCAALALSFTVRSALLAAPMLPAGAGLVPTGLLVLLFGATRPDPRLTTVRGVFGNAEENLLTERLRAQQRPRVDPRFLPSPRESVHCAGCYTLIPAQVVLCPRCGRRRRCHQCDKPLFHLAGAVRCGPCTKDEVYCDCPPTRSPRRGTPFRAPLAR